MKDWESHLSRKEEAFVESQLEHSEAIKEKELELSQSFQELDRTRADLDEAQCSFRKVLPIMKHPPCMITVFLQFQVSKEAELNALENRLRVFETDLEERTKELQESKERCKIALKQLEENEESSQKDKIQVSSTHHSSRTCFTLIVEDVCA